MKKIILYFSLVLIIIVTQKVNSQTEMLNSVNNFVCGSVGDVNGYGGWNMPIEDDTLKVLVVYCNFPSPSGNYDPKHDISPDLIICNYWPRDSAQRKPSWADSVICPTTTNVWDNSMTALMRDASFGKFWLIGDVYQDLYVFKEQKEYYGDPSRGMGFLTKEVLEGIDKRVDYTKYDRFDPWDLDGDDNRREPDGRVDFIFLVFRFVPASLEGESYTGICGLTGYQGRFGANGPDSLVLDGKSILAQTFGSGCLVEQREPWEYKAHIHEFLQHYVYGPVHNDLGYWNINGGTYPSAPDREVFGWTSRGTTYQPAVNTTITLRDYISEGDYIKIPHSGNTLYIENRRRIKWHAKHQWHNWTWKADVSYFPNMRDSGVFIYMQNSGNPNSFGQYHAFGKWDFEKCPGGEYKISDYMFYNHFNTANPNLASGISVTDLYTAPQLGHSLPVRDENCNMINQYGANRPELSYIGWQGDSNSCFDIGYNQVFSPWSNPPLTAANASDSLCIELLQRDVNGNMQVKVYFTNLLAAPPSKPTGVKIVNCADMINFYYRPKITWVHNIEPDMIRTINGVNKKRYKIWRVDSPNMGTALNENSYTLISTVDINENDNPSYIDSNVIARCNELPDASCPPTCWVEYPLRYRVQAVDNTDLVSVRSDFVGTTGWRNGYNGGIGTDGGEDRPVRPQDENSLPKNFALSQNYPNPFNPVTNIFYSVPKESLVKIIIYDILGREVLVLVNDVKTAGVYSAQFNGSDFTSGIYYYRMISDNVDITKKMLLVK